MTKKNVGKDFFVGYGIGAAMLSLSTLIMVVLGSAKIQGFHFTLDMLIVFLELSPIADDVSPLRTELPSIFNFARKLLNSRRV